MHLVFDGDGFFWWILLQKLCQRCHVTLSDGFAFEPLVIRLPTDSNHCCKLYYGQFADSA